MIGWKKKIAAYLSLALLAGVICACGSVSSDQDQIPTEKEETTTDFDSTDETEETLPETEAIDEIEESIIETETETESETILPESETATAEEMAISEMDALMYAQANVNIRASYSADSEKLGTLQKGNSIKVTGVTADQNWYRVEYKEAEAFVSASYLGLEKPAEEAPTPVVENPAVEQEPRQELTENDDWQSQIDSSQSVNAGGLAGAEDISDRLAGINWDTGEGFDWPEGLEPHHY